MNREIKFRAWIISISEYSYDVTLFANGFITCVMEDGREFTLKPEEYQIEQFTELKDVNDKEIFEGDSNGIEIIEYCSDYGGFVMYNKETQRYRNLTCDTAMFFSIKGNIYENPQLINRKLWTIKTLRTI